MKNWLIAILTVILLAGCIRKEPADTSVTAQGTTQSTEQGSTQSTELKPGQNTEPGTAQNTQQGSTEMKEESEKTAVKLYFDSLPEILPFAGKELAELGYTEKDLQDNMYLRSLSIRSAMYGRSR